MSGVATFYTQFRHKPVGRHIISVCHGTACHVKGSERVQEALERQLGIARTGHQPRQQARGHDVIANIARRCGRSALLGTRAPCESETEQGE